MDDRGENITWVGNIFQKLEDFCTEVDGAVWEEIRNVENHLQTIGANVVNFCLDMVLDDPPQSLDDKVEETADGSIDILVSDASKLCIDEDHYEEDTKEEAAYEVLVSDTSEMYTDGEDHSEGEREEETDYDIDVLVSDASETDADDDHSEGDTEEETDSEIDSLVSDASDIDTDEHYSEDDTEEKALYDINFLVPDSSRVGIDEDHKKVLIDFHHRFCSASVEPTEGVQVDSSLLQNVDSEVYETSKVIVEENLVKHKKCRCEMSDAVAPKEDNFSLLLSYNSVNLVESCDSQGLHIEATPHNASRESPDDCIAEDLLDNDITKLVKETAESFQEMKLDESCIIIDRVEFERKREERLTGDAKTERQKRGMKTIKISGVSIATQEDELADCDWVIV